MALWLARLWPCFSISVPRSSKLHRNMADRFVWWTAYEYTTLDRGGEGGGDDGYFAVCF